MTCRPRASGTTVSSSCDVWRLWHKKWFAAHRSSPSRLTAHSLGDCDKLLDWCDAAARPLQPLRPSSRDARMNTATSEALWLLAYVCGAGCLWLFLFVANIIYDTFKLAPERGDPESDEEDTRRMDRVESDRFCLVKIVLPPRRPRQPKKAGYSRRASRARSSRD